MHESAIIEFEGVLYASWYNNLEDELSGYTPIAERRSYDGGKTWTDLQIICEDKEEKIKYCPPVYGICDGNLSDGRTYLIANVEEFDRSKLVLYLSEPGKEKFSQQLVLFDKRTCGLDNAEACHYSAACEWNGKLWIIASLNSAWLKRSAVVFTVEL